LDHAALLQEGQQEEQMGEQQEEKQGEQQEEQQGEQQQEQHEAEQLEEQLEGEQPQEEQPPEEQLQEGQPQEEHPEQQQPEQQQTEQQQPGEVVQDEPERRARSPEPEGDPPRFPTLDVTVKETYRPAWTTQLRVRAGEVLTAVSHDPETRQVYALNEKGAYNWVPVNILDLADGALQDLTDERRRDTLEASAELNHLADERHAQFERRFARLVDTVARVEALMGQMEAQIAVKTEMLEGD
jgi:DNA mismatch repair ATPase MutL